MKKNLPKTKNLKEVKLNKTTSVFVRGNGDHYSVIEREVVVKEKFVAAFPKFIDAIEFIDRNYKPVEK